MESLIMRNKPDIDQTGIDELYNNLRVYEDEMQRSSSSTSNSQNLAFLSFENTSSTNEVSTASENFGVNTAGGTSSTSQGSSTPVLMKYKIMSITKEQQQALDDALLPREQRLTIGSCNYRLSTTFKPKEPTFQVALDVLTLTPFYLAFLITLSVPTVYM
ncbi:hypothetical protein Tco_1458985 [Tanacetum coccineum]